MTKRLLALVVGLTTALAAAPSAADEIDDIRAARERVRSQQSEVVADLDVLRAQDAEIAAALATLEANVAAEEAQLAAAQQAAVEAEQELAEAEAKVARTEADIEVQEENLRHLAVRAYMSSGQKDPLVVILQAEDAADALQDFGLIDAVATDIDAAVERLERARRRLAALEEKAREAAEVAEGRRADAEERLAAVAAARDAQAAFAAEVQARIEARLAEAAALADLDAELGQQLREQQEALLAEARARARRRGGGGGNVSLVDPADLRTVRGITVHVSIADELEAMLAAAEADGIHLGGGGFRSSASQIRLREQHCPDVWNSPPSACSPPTARPGHSLHEQGLAIDFTYEGRAIPSHASPAFRWLDANAERFGFYNLPSEPWHWSTTGG